MDQQIAIRRAAAALDEAHDALKAILPVNVATDLWEVAEGALREALLQAWLWETVKEDPLLQKRVSVDELWAAWAQLWGREPGAKEAGGYPRRVWTQAVSMLPDKRGSCLGPRTAKRGANGKVQRFWLGFEMIPGRNA